MSCQEREASTVLRHHSKQLRGQVILYGNNDRDPLMFRKLDLGKWPEHTVLKDSLDRLVFRHVLSSVCEHFMMTCMA
jgi:hypothetical protein